MYLGGKWFEECEVNAEFKNIQEELKDTKEDLIRAKALLAQIRCYYSATAGWDMYEDEVIALIGKKRGDAN